MTVKALEQEPIAEPDIEVWWDTSGRMRQTITYTNKMVVEFDVHKMQRREDMNKQRNAELLAKDESLKAAGVDTALYSSVSPCCVCAYDRKLPLSRFCGFCGVWR